PPVLRSTGSVPVAPDAPVVARLAPASRGRRPLGAVQPQRPVRLDCRARPPRRRQRRLPPSRAPARLEDAPSVLEGRDRRRRLPPVAAADVPHADRPARGAPAGRLKRTAPRRAGALPFAALRRVREERTPGPGVRWAAIP